MPDDLHHCWQRAASFAARSHHGQMRKDRATPYIAHPYRVAMIVRHVFGVEDEAAMCIALLHDVIEDTQADYDDVLRHFGQEIADAVACLTKDKRMHETHREPAFFKQIACGSWQARLVKLADNYDNICDAADDATRRKAVAKVEHTIAAAGDDPRLAGAVAKLRELAARVGG